MILITNDELIAAIAEKIRHKWPSLKLSSRMALGKLALEAIEEVNLKIVEKGDSVE